MDRSQHVMRQLLSYLPYQDTTPSHHGPSYKASPSEDVLTGGRRETVQVLGPAKVSWTIISRILTLNPSQHIMRQLLSYVTHQETTPSHHGSSYQVPLQPPPPKPKITAKTEITKNSRSRAHMRVRRSSWVFWTAGMSLSRDYAVILSLV